MLAEVVRMIASEKSHFVRCENPFDVPESLCTHCLRTIVARDYDALEQAEDRHDCTAPRYRAAGVHLV
jgi:hypothetical protein